MLGRLVVAACFAAIALAKTVTYDFNVTWVNANPDGLYERRVVGFNNEWPLPNIEVDTGDRLIVNVTNMLPLHNTSLHFHGLFQNGSVQMDGPEMITQCPIAPGELMVYNFTVPDQIGTFWYHSHTKGQYGDGMRAAFVIRNATLPYDYDEEVVLTISEWYHEELDVLDKAFLNRYNPTGAEPIPQSTLWNDTRNGTWKVEPGKTYLMRIVNVGAFVLQYLWMEDHTFKVIEVDGIYVEPNETEVVYITVAQRYTVLIETKNTTDKNYAFMQAIDTDMLDTQPASLVVNSTNWIVYNESAELPGELSYPDTEFLDDFYLEPIEQEENLGEPDLRVQLDVVMDNLGNGVNYAFFNNITFTQPKVPVLTTVMTSGNQCTDATIYGTNTNAFVLEKDDIIEIVLNNNDTGKHPFHLHGHAFQVIERGPSYADEPGPVPWNASAEYEEPEYPMRRDVLYVRPQLYFRIRFKANNPGVWYFHCHLEWHLLQGLAAVFVEDPEAVQNEVLTELWLNTCKSAGVPVSGNAAANSVDFLDLTGENVQHKPLPSGFTKKGIIAMTFLCLAGVLGIAAIAVYGLSEIPSLTQVADDFDVDVHDLIAEEEVSGSTDSAELRRDATNGDGSK